MRRVECGVKEIVVTERVGECAQLDIPPSETNSLRVVRITSHSMLDDTSFAVDRRIVNIRSHTLIMSYK